MTALSTNFQRQKGCLVRTQSLQKFMYNVSVHKLVGTMMNMEQLTSYSGQVPVGLKHIPRDIFTCSICHLVPIKSPLLFPYPSVIVTECCKTSFGWEDCVNEWSHRSWTSTVFLVFYLPLGQGHMYPALSSRHQRTFIRCWMQKPYNVELLFSKYRIFFTSSRILLKSFIKCILISCIQLSVQLLCIPISNTLWEWNLMKCKDGLLQPALFILPMHCSMKILTCDRRVLCWQCMCKCRGPTADCQSICTPLSPGWGRKENQMVQTAVQSMHGIEYQRSYAAS